MRILIIIIISCVAAWAIMERSNLKTELSIVRERLIVTQKENDDFRKTVSHLSPAHQKALASLSDAQAQLAQAQAKPDKPKGWLQERIEGRNDPLSQPPTTYAPTYISPYSGYRPVTPNSRVIR